MGITIGKLVCKDFWERLEELVLLQIFIDGRDVGYELLLDLYNI